MGLGRTRRFGVRFTTVFMGSLTPVLGSARIGRDVTHAVMVVFRSQRRPVCHASRANSTFVLAAEPWFTREGPGPIETRKCAKPFGRGNLLGPRGPAAPRHAHSQGSRPVRVPEQIAKFLRGKKPNRYCDDCIAKELALGSGRNRHMANNTTLAFEQCPKEFLRLQGICDDCREDKQVIRAV